MYIKEYYEYCDKMILIRLNVENIFEKLTSRRVDELTSVICLLWTYLLELSYSACLLVNSSTCQLKKSHFLM
jgi:hypothetical protein